VPATVVAGSANTPDDTAARGNTDADDPRGNTDVPATVVAGSANTPDDTAAGNSEEPEGNNDDAEGAVGAVGAGVNSDAPPAPPEKGKPLVAVVVVPAGATVTAADDAAVAADAAVVAGAGSPSTMPSNSDELVPPAGATLRTLNIPHSDGDGGVVIAIIAVVAGAVADDTAGGDGFVLPPKLNDRAGVVLAAAAVTVAVDDATAVNAADADVAAGAKASPEAADAARVVGANDVAKADAAALTATAVDAASPTDSTGNEMLLKRVAAAVAVVEAAGTALEPAQTATNRGAVHTGDTPLLHTAKLW
jgi:hypothetical protein